MKTKILFVVLSFCAQLFLLPAFNFAQDDTDILDYFKHFKISGYIDGYYAWDTDKDKSERQFSAISIYRDEFRINFAQASVKYFSDNVRGAFTIHMGDVPNYTWPSENRLIQEANIGFSPVENLWFDFGYYITHLGAESSLPKDNFLNSYSLPGFFEPDYQSGLKIGYSFSEKFNACLHLINGHQVFADNNKNKSIGITLNYTPFPQLSFTYNNLIGNENPSSVNSPKTRFFNNFVISYSPSEKIDLLADFDFVTQEKSKLTDPNESANLFGGFFGMRYKFTPKFSTSLRGDYLSDADGFLTGTYIDENNNTTGFKAFAFSLGCEYKPVDFGYVRIEGRVISADKKLKIFYSSPTSLTNNRSDVILSTGLEF